MHDSLWLQGSHFLKKLILKDSDRKTHPSRSIPTLLLGILIWIFCFFSIFFFSSSFISFLSVDWLDLKFPYASEQCCIPFRFGNDPMILEWPPYPVLSRLLQKLQFLCRHSISNSTMRKRNENANPREFPKLRIIKQLPLPSTLFICGLLAASIPVFHVFQLMWSSMLTQVASKFIKFSRSTRTQYKRNSHISTFPRLDNGWNVCSAAKQIPRNDFRNTYFQTSKHLFLPFSIMKMERNGNERLFWSFWGKKPTRTAAAPRCRAAQKGHGRLCNQLKTLYGKMVEWEREKKNKESERKSERERERNTYLRQHIDCKCTINIYIYTVWYPSVNHDALSYRLLSKLSGKKNLTFPLNALDSIPGRFPGKKMRLIISFFLLFKNRRNRKESSYRVGNDNGASNQLIFYRSALSIGGSAIIIFVSNRMSRAALEARKIFFDCDCYDLAAGGPMCMQGARFNTPSDTLVRSYRVALKLRKRTKKTTFSLEHHDRKIQEQNQIRTWNINKVKYIEEVKKNISIWKNWKERHSHESEDDGSL